MCLKIRGIIIPLGAVHFHLVAWYLETSLLVGAGVETSERALRERIVWRAERFPVGVSVLPGLHVLPCASGLPGPSLTLGNVELCATSADVGPPGVVSGTSSVEGYNGPEAPSRPPVGESQHQAHSLKAANPRRPVESIWPIWPRPPLEFHFRETFVPPARARNLSYARAVLASSGTSPAAFSGNFPSPQSLSFVEPVRDNGRVKVIPLRAFLRRVKVIGRTL